MSDAVEVVRRAPYGANPIVGDRARKTYERILKASLRSFDRYGFDEANIDDIAKSARTSRATVYQYFESKQDILAALSLQLGNEIMASVDAMPSLDGGDESRQELRTWVRNLHHLSRDYAPVLDVWTSLSGRAPEEELNDAFMKRFAKHFAARAAIGSETGMDSSVAASVVFTIVQGTSDNLRADGVEDAEADELLDRVADLIHRALFV